MTLPNPIASMPIPSTNGQYRMGPNLAAGSGDYTWNYQWADGTYAVAGEPAGWESLSFITPIDQVGGRDGGLVGPQSVTPRILEVSAALVAVNEALMRQHLATIRGILGPQGLPGPRQPVVWEQYDWGTARRLALVCRPLNDFAVVVYPGGGTEGGLAATVTFTLVAAEPPWKYQAGSGESNQVGLANPGLVSGRTYDKTYSYTYGGGSLIGGEMTCTNNGDLPAYPLFTITGPVDFPIISDATTGLSFQINANLASTDTVTIDARTGVVTPSNVRLVGRPFPLAPGANAIRFRSFSGTYYPAAVLRLDWRSTFR